MSDDSAERAPRGLAEADAQARLKTEGYNELPRREARSIAGIILGVVREGGRFNYETPFSTRLFSIACRLVQRERSRSPQRGDAAALPDAAPPGETLENSIERAVDALPEAEKDVFLLREVADLPFAEIARVTQRTETAVKIQMQHALQRLRLTLQRFDEYRRALR